MRRAVLFDVGHTLWDWRGGRGHLEEVAAEAALQLGVDDQHHALLREAVLRAAWRIAESYARADRHEIDFLNVLAREMSVLGEPLAPADARLVAHLLFEREDRISNMPEHVPVVLAELAAAGFELGAISNSPVPGSYMRGLLRSRGLDGHLRILISSADFGLRKPHPDIFAAGCRALGVRPERAIYVGDRVREDVRGPKAAGLFGVLTREHRTDEVVTDEPDAVLTSLRELPAIAARLVPRR